MTVLVTLAAFLIVLSVLVLVHEAGHALVARACGARVTELFLGMPAGPEVSWTSRRTGIRYGATLALVGGYTRISGMLPCDEPCAPLALALVNARGRLGVDEMARVLGGEDAEVRARVALETLADWGSVARVWPTGRRGRSGEPIAYTTVGRDAAGLTVHDRGYDFATGAASRAGEPFDPGMAADAFFEVERSRTYQGLSFARRAAVLVAGVVFNLASALIIFALFLMLHGVATGVSLEVAEVGQGSPAASAGIEAGDRIVAVAGGEVADAQALTDALALARERGDAFEVTLERDGRQRTVTTALNDEGLLGIYLGYEYTALSPGEALSAGVSYIGQVGSQIVRLLVPTQTAEVLGNSSGVVGIAVMTSQAVEGGLWNVALLAAMLSVSLAWMNLLPIPPLDGGKLLMEVVAALRRRPVSANAQAAASMVGTLLFVALFLYMVVLDVSRLAGF